MDPFVIGVIAGIIFGIGISLFWDDIREQVAAWLRQKGWENSVLMDAWIKLDSLIGFVRCRIFVKTKKKSKVKISEQEYDIDEIDDPEVLEELQRKGHVKKNIMTLIQ